MLPSILAGASPNHLLLAIEAAAAGPYPAMVPSTAALASHLFEASLDFVLSDQGRVALSQRIWASFSGSVAPALLASAGPAIARVHTRLVEATSVAITSIGQGKVDGIKFRGNSVGQKSANKNFAAYFRGLREQRFATPFLLGKAAKAPVQLCDNIEAGKTSGAKYWGQLAPHLGVELEDLQRQYEIFASEEKFFVQKAAAPYRLMGHDIQLRRLARGWDHQKVGQDLRATHLKSDRSRYMFIDGTDVQKIENGVLYYFTPSTQISYSRLFGLEEYFYARYLVSATAYIEEKNPGTVAPQTDEIGVDGQVTHSELLQAIEIVMGEKVLAVRVIANGYEVTTENQVYTLVKTPTH